MASKSGAPPTDRLRSRSSPAGRGLIGLSAGLLLAVAPLVGCRPDADRAERSHLPSEWYSARVDPETEGRYLAAANRELTRFQDRVLRSRDSIPYAHYDAPGTVAMAVKSSLVSPRIRRRLEILLETESAGRSRSTTSLSRWTGET